MKKRRIKLLACIAVLLVTLSACSYMEDYIDNEQSESIEEVYSDIDYDSMEKKYASLEEYANDDEVKAYYSEQFNYIPDIPNVIDEYTSVNLEAADDTFTITIRYNYITLEMLMEEAGYKKREKRKFKEWWAESDESMYRICDGRAILGEVKSAVDVKDPIVNVKMFTADGENIYDKKFKMKAGE